MGAALAVLAEAEDCTSEPRDISVADTASRPQTQDVAPVPVLPTGPAPGRRAARRPPGGAMPPAPCALPEPAVTQAELKQILEQHTATVLSEVQRLLPALAQQAGGSELDPSTLTDLLVQRDEEVRQLEEELRELQGILASKDQRVAQLDADLAVAVREKKHRQLDVEFQHVRLEERLRGNAELEASQRVILAQLEESWGASASPTHVHRLQGALPWTVRNKKPGIPLSPRQVVPPLSFSCMPGSLRLT